MKTKSYPLFSKKNIPAYLAVMAIWAAITVVSAVSLSAVASVLSFKIALVWAAISVMAGMAIMFVASVINLRKLAPGFRMMSEGKEDPQIPPVCCPVLTAATNAAFELQSKLLDQTKQR